MKWLCLRGKNVILISYKGIIKRRRDVFRFEKTDDILHYRSGGPRVSSGYVSADSSNRDSPDKQRKLITNTTNNNHNPNTNNSNNNFNNNRRGKVAPTNNNITTKGSGSSGISNDSNSSGISNGGVNISSIAHTIASESAISKSAGSTIVPKHSRSYATEAAKLETEDFELQENEFNESIDKAFDNSTNSNHKMAPNNSNGVSQDDPSAIISGHKIALNVHYQQDTGADARKHGYGSGSPPGSGGGVTPVVIDEQPALRELDAVIASAQRSASVHQDTPEHYVDAAETISDLHQQRQLHHHHQQKQRQKEEEEVKLEEEEMKITHVDGILELSSHIQDQSTAVEKGSASSITDLGRTLPEEQLVISTTPNSGSTFSVDGQVLGTPVEEEQPQQQEEEQLTLPTMDRQDQYLNGPDQIIPASSFKTWLPTGAVQMHVGQEGLNSQTPISVPTLLRKTAEKYPNHNAMMEKQGNEWIPTTYSEYYKQVRLVAKAFIKLGLEPYRGVCILGFNSKEWFISDLAAIFAGGFAAGIYTTNSAEACQHCALNCQAQVWIVEDQNLLDKVLKIRGNIPSLKVIVQYKGKPTVDGVYSWDQILDIGRNESDAELEGRLKRIAVNQCCTLIYTSGTTGPPKGVMLSHDNITWTALSSSIYFKMTPTKETVVSYLPLSHVAAQLADIYMAVVTAGTAYFAQPDALKGSLGVTLKEVRPTAFLGVPRVWEKIYEKMMDVGRKTKGVKKSIATWAKALGLEANDRKQNSDYSKPFGFSVANAVVFKKVKQVLGLDRCKVFLSGAAPISPDIVRYFHSLDITLVEIYGMSESSGPHTTGTEAAFKVGSAGRNIPGVMTKIDKPDAEGNGEVCMNGRNVAMGYLLKEETTNETVDDMGWLHSGDIGKVDEQGFLFITGRLKELIITAGGENIPPVMIEEVLKSELSCISNAMLIGDKRKFLSILLTLKTNMNLDTGEALDTLSPACIEWCQSIGSNSKCIYDVLAGPDPKIMRAIQDGIDRANKNAASNAQKIQKWTILPRDFTVLGDELGPTMKLKRPVVNKKYAETIERFYV